jgi:hypothetical protein
MTTITLSSIPDLTGAVGAPRLAAIEYPLGYLLGQPGDAEGQRAVLRSTLRAVAEIPGPGGVVQLPFEWLASARRLSARPPKTPPIIRYLLRHPWHIPNLFSREIPSAQARPGPGRSEGIGERSGSTRSQTRSATCR